MNGSLFLSPSAAHSHFSDTQATLERLTALQLIGKPFNQVWLCGEQFPHLITFMGCSPFLQFEPPADGSQNFCHVEIHHFTDIRVFTGSQTAPPRCPHCRHRFADWKASLPVAGVAFDCPKCEHSLSQESLDWRQSGGAGCFFIEIHHIFPGEAVPADKLMHELQKLSGESWKYFYIADS